MASTWRMRSRLNELIAGAGITARSSDRGAAGEWLATKCSRHVGNRRRGMGRGAQPASSSSSGSRAPPNLRSLPADVREAALRSLADWAEQSIGPLDSADQRAPPFLAETLLV